MFHNTPEMNHKIYEAVRDLIYDLKNSYGQAVVKEECMRVANELKVPAHVIINKVQSGYVSTFGQANVSEYVIDDILDHLEDEEFDEDDDSEWEWYEDEE